jgi:hypothetical protein
MDKNIIICERQRPLWQRVVASLFFTLAIAYLAYVIPYIEWNEKDPRNIGYHIERFIILMTFGISFSFHKSVYIDLKNSKFRSTFEIGPIKLDEWKTINNYEYVSIFHEHLIDGRKIFEVNLWYDRNKHWELYEKYTFEDAFAIGYEISEVLNIGLLDATKPNNYRRVDKEALKKTGIITYLN